MEPARSLFPDPPPPELAQTLDLAGYPWKARRPPRTTAARIEPDDGWAGAVVDADDDPEAAFALCRTLRKRDVPLEPLLLLVLGRPARRPRAARRPLRRLLPRALPPGELEAPAQAPLLAQRAAAPGPSSSSTARSCSTSRPTRPPSPARPLDLTYMEYELLKFLASAPRQGVHPRDAAQPGVGLRVLRRRPHGRRPHPAAAGQARRGARQPHPDRALGRLPLRPEPLGRLTEPVLLADRGSGNPARQEISALDGWGQGS